MNKRLVLLIASLAALAFGAAVLLANNQGRADNLADELVEATDVLPENEGRLVIVSGTPQLADGGVLIDEEANLQVENAVFYSRVPYQKVYVKEKAEVVVDKGDDKVSEADDKKETRYYVVEDWIIANHERDAVVTGTARHENPAPLNMDSYHASSDLLLSGFRISPADVSYYITLANGRFTPEELGEACEHYIIRSEIDLQPVMGEYGYGMLSSGDEVGDVHVHFDYQTLESAEAVTIIGRQRGDELVLEDEDLVRESEQVQQGVISKDEFLASIASRDASSKKYGIGSLALGVILLLLSIL